MKAGLIDNADRQVTIGFFANTSCNRFGEIVRPIRLEPDGTEKYRGNFLMTLDASLGRCLN